MLTWGGTVAPVRPPRTGAARRADARRRMARVAGLGLAVALVAAGMGPATAAKRADPGGSCPPEQHDCSVWDDDPGTPGGGGDSGGGGGDSGGGGGGKCQWNGRTVKCYDDLLGWFNNADGCYYKLEDPQPPDTPEGKQWYLVTCNGGDRGDQHEELLDGPPPGYGAPPDPEELARRALARISIRPPRIAVAPRRATGPGLVGLPVWMWGENAAQTFGPVISDDETERGLTVEITAVFDRIVWDMDNGEQVTCTGPGTEYKVTGPHAGKRSPTCGYHSGYPKADTYEVSATTYWTVTWEGGGETGVIPVQRRTGTVPIQINELQVVTR
ncbi:hypothetical protein SAMN05444858_103314 [Micromonospora avicenniae]|uniref:ATP/GTP-binding protein n=2 Tax=Micromonospora avicenniae TaxID=1198245 RepID=A0A1N6UCF7_9ACTN|nr:hypothetical protein SAMN05444858_103314 [Micromonospora avicenniae]